MGATDFSFEKNLLRHLGSEVTKHTSSIAATSNACTRFSNSRLAPLAPSRARTVSRPLRLRPLFFFINSHALAEDRVYVYGKTYRPTVAGFRLSISAGGSGGGMASAAAECMLHVLPVRLPDVDAVRKALRYELYFRPKVKSKSPRGR